MDFKPYKDIQTAIAEWKSNYWLQTGEVKIKCHENLCKDERSLIDATFLCKVFLTFDKNYDVLKRQYNIRHVGHLLWDYTTWRMKFIQSTCTFEIHSSYFMSQDEYISQNFEDKPCGSYEIGLYASYLKQYINEVLKNLSRYAPQERYNTIRDQILRISNCE